MIGFEVAWPVFTAGKFATLLLPSELGMLIGFAPGAGMVTILPLPTAPCAPVLIGRNGRLDSRVNCISGTAFGCACSLNACCA